ncbi:MAG: pentapeptide repeat-containing protein [Candidatus Saccharibacteria bacterium]|nr:pentapeptide repeat-containing protein [Rhodoferax sp.]
MTEKLTFRDKNLSGSSFEMVNLEGVSFQNANLGHAKFQDINLGGATFNDINFSDVVFSMAQLRGTVFKQLGLPPGSPEKQRGITFEEDDMNDSVFSDCNLQNARIEKSNTTGMTIDGVLVSELLASYAERNNKP